ncbi:MAG: hypothetical protein ACYSTL_01115 [Planctomycetota bacterium]
MAEDQNQNNDEQQGEDVPETPAGQQADTPAETPETPAETAPESEASEESQPDEQGEPAGEDAPETPDPEQKDDSAEATETPAETAPEGEAPEGEASEESQPDEQGEPAGEAESPPAGEQEDAPETESEQQEPLPEKALDEQAADESGETGPQSTESAESPESVGDDTDTDQKPDLEKQIEAKMLEELRRDDAEAGRAKEPEGTETSDAQGGKPAGRKRKTPDPEQIDIRSNARGGVVPVEKTPAPEPVKSKQISLIQILLLFNGVIVVLLLVGLITLRPWKPETATGTQQMSTPQRAVVPPAGQQEAPQPQALNRAVIKSPAPQRTVIQRPAPQQTVPRVSAPTLPQHYSAEVKPVGRGLARDPSAVVLSWSKAEEALLNGRYREALDAYNALLDYSKARQENQRISDFLTFRVGQCMTHLGHGDRAEKMYVKAAMSESPIVRAMAHYQLAVRDVLGGQFMRGRMRAYLGIAALAEVDVPLELETDCDVLIARALTQKVIDYYGTDELMKWNPMRISDPFAGFGESRARKLLTEGGGRVTHAVLGPQIEQIEALGRAKQYSVTCARTSIDELLVSFAGKTNVDLKWINTTRGVRSRPVSIHCPRVTEQRFSEVTCGAVGLLSRYTGDGIHIYDPHSYEVLSQQRALLAREAISAWRRLSLKMQDDSRLAQAHFALGVLYELTDELTDAMGEYQLIAKRFEKMDIGAAGLLRSASLRIRLRDFTGARMDLLTLLDQYPNCTDSDKVYLYLGQATMKAGLVSDATGVFRKLYYMNLSSESQRAACIGSARCFYQMGDFEETHKWATRYIGLVSSPEQELAEAYLLLGESEAALDRGAEAVEAFHYVLASQPSSETRVRAILKLAEVESGRGNFVNAIAALDRIRGLKLTQEQTYPYLLKTAEVFRAMGISQKAASIIRNRLSAVVDPEMRGKLAVELARCYIDENDLEVAGIVLAEFLPKLEPGPTAQEAECLLAEVALNSGRTSQAITISSELLRSNCNDDIRRRAQEVLGSAYIARQDYENAAMTYSGLLFKQGGQTK